jgi:hypothetical protein
LLIINNLARLALFFSELNKEADELMAILTTIVKKEKAQK